jgi:hypothetical protein
VIKGHPGWTFFIWLGIERGISRMPDDDTRSWLSVAVLLYGAYLFWNYWFRARPARLEAASMAQHLEKNLGGK